MPNFPAHLEHQDWDTVFLRSKAQAHGQTKTQQVQTALQKGAVVETVDRRKNADVSHKNRALENDTETLSHETVSHDLKVAIQKARQAKKMTQKQLAMALNERPSVINDYESGKAVPNGQLIARIEKALGCKLPRQK